MGQSLAKVLEAIRRRSTTAAPATPQSDSSEASGIIYAWLEAKIFPRDFSRKLPGEEGYIEGLISPSKNSSSRYNGSAFKSQFESFLDLEFEITPVHTVERGESSVRNKESGAKARGSKTNDKKRVSGTVKRSWMDERFERGKDEDDE